MYDGHSEGQGISHWESTAPKKLNWTTIEAPGLQYLGLQETQVGI